MVLKRLGCYCNMYAFSLVLLLFVKCRTALTRYTYKESCSKLGFDSYIDIVHVDEAERSVRQYESSRLLFSDSPFIDQNASI